ncbi:hypothetical protein PHLCEN_2v4855 [Hermanssonia centrifuga]|uniref:CHAT domain-containing protein n=1 Tax=Hermanssonia centrifuga TaxID=98765 RepID=A0A2R6PG85_9APHY|nr:hypothetical protein PHLCEN_2v4855 [Hermanssonia centrifuga]
MDCTSLSGPMLACGTHSDDPAIRSVEEALSHSSSSNIEYTPALEKAMDDSYYVVYKGAIHILRHISRLHVMFTPFGGLILPHLFPDSDTHIAPSMDTAKGLSERGQTLASLYKHISTAQTIFRTNEQVTAPEPSELCECSLHLALVFSQIAIQKTEPSDDSDRSRRLDRQIELLSERAKLPGFETDLNLIVAICKETLAHPLEETHSLQRIQRYVKSLLSRFNFFHDTADLEEIIPLLQQYADDPTGELRNCRETLCDARCKLFSLCGGADNLTFAIAAIQHLLLAPIRDKEWRNLDHVRLQKGRSLLALIFEKQPAAEMDQQHGIALLELYREMLRLPYRMMRVGMDLHLSLPRLSRVQELASEAFEYALLFSSPEEAVEMLEKGRDVFWTQTLRLRSSFDDLPPHLAERLKIVTPKLESYIHMMYSTNWEHDLDRYKQELDVLRSTQKEFQSLAEEVRQLEGYERFMTDPDPHFSSLAMAAQKGPVVILVARETCTDAIIVRSPTSGAEHLVLGGISIKRLSDIFIQMKDYNTRSRESPVDTSYDSADDIPSVRAGGDRSLNILWQEVVRPVINALGYQKAVGRDRPRLWWCPTGHFMSVPLHAAGDYRGNGDCCSDYVVSSYTRSLQALSNARQNLESILASDPRVLLAAETNTSNLTPLPNVAKEIAAVKLIIPSHAIISLGGDELGSASVDSEEAGHSTRVQDVVEAFPQASIVHLACHGIQRDASDSATGYASEALTSGFCLRDGNLTILNLLRLGAPRAFFAFLSACESVKEAQLDESVHLTAALMFCGFRSVVATMWSMDDLDGPEVAEAIYTELFRGSPFNPDDIPYALDAAVKGMRARGLPPSRWATYSHMGV